MIAKNETASDVAMTRAELARKTGFHVSTLKSWERRTEWDFSPPFSVSEVMAWHKRHIDQHKGHRHQAAHKGLPAGYGAHRVNLENDESRVGMYVLRDFGASVFVGDKGSGHSVEINSSDGYSSVSLCRGCSGQLSLHLDDDGVPEIVLRNTKSSIRIGFDAHGSPEIVLEGKNGESLVLGPKTCRKTVKSK